MVVLIVVFLVFGFWFLCFLMLTWTNMIGLVSVAAEWDVLAGAAAAGGHGMH